MIWRNLVTMSMQLESREKFISSWEICKENAAKEIPVLKYLMKLFQNQKLESELNDFQSVLIVSSHPIPFRPITRKVNFREMDKGATNFGGHLLILSYHCN